MGRKEKLRQLVLHGNRTDIRFDQLQSFLVDEGFTLKSVKGDHFIYAKDGIDAIINIQPKNGKAKPYQVEQTRRIIDE